MFYAALRQRLHWFFCSPRSTLERGRAAAASAAGPTRAAGTAGRRRCRRVPPPAPRAAAAAFAAANPQARSEHSVREWRMQMSPLSHGIHTLYTDL